MVCWLGGCLVLRLWVVVPVGLICGGVLYLSVFSIWVNFVWVDAFVILVIGLSVLFGVWFRFVGVLLSCWLIVVFDFLCCYFVALV